MIITLGKLFDKMNSKHKRETKKEAFLSVLFNNEGNISKSCIKSNISRSSVYQWINEDDDFKDRVEQVGDELLDMVESALIQKIKDGNLTAIIFYLKTKGQGRGYIERQYVNQTKTFGNDTLIVE